MNKGHKLILALGVISFLLAGFARTQQLVIKSRAPTVCIAGLVLKPGVQAWAPDLTLKGVIKQAGDFGVKLDRAAILRGDERITVDLPDLFLGRVADPKLQPDDYIEVPEVGPAHGDITIVRGHERIQVKMRDLRHGINDPKLQPDDIVIINTGHTYF